jgi:hypothetical protein
MSPDVTDQILREKVALWCQPNIPELR